LNVTTAYEYLEKRFNVVVRLWGSVTFILFQIGRMGIVLLLPAIALTAATGVDICLSIAIMGVLCTIYTVLGGIEAVIWTDVLQVFVLLGGAIISLFVIAGQVDGGFAGIIDIARQGGKFHMFNWTWDYTIMAVWVVVVGNLFGNLVPYTTDQAVVQRYLTTKDEKQAARSIWTNAILVIPGSIVFFSIGTALYVFFKSHPQALEPGLQHDAIFPLFIVQQLPVGIAGLVIAGVFAASMSSLDSSLNSVATALVTDFYRRFKPNADDHTCLRLARGLTVVLGVAATASALYMGSYGGQIRSLWFLFAKILGLLGGALAGIFALAIFSRRANGVGAIVGAAAGIAVTIHVWQHNLMHFYLWAGVGVGVTCVVGYLVSLMVPISKDVTGLTIYTLPAKEEAAG
ncbi:sodium/solute symporter, partial [bacterium]|nr:sodium/solute symporter [bacterium]